LHYLIDKELWPEYQNPKYNLYRIEEKEVLKRIDQRESDVFCIYTTANQFSVYNKLKLLLSCIYLGSLIIIIIRTTTTFIWDH
jgi:hypothetical protein